MPAIFFLSGLAQILFRADVRADPVLQPGFLRADLVREGDQFGRCCLGGGIKGLAVMVPEKANLVPQFGQAAAIPAPLQSFQAVAAAAGQIVEMDAALVVEEWNIFQSILLRQMCGDFLGARECPDPKNDHVLAFKHGQCLPKALNFSV